MCRNTWKFPQRRCSFTLCTQRLSTFYPFSSKPTGYTGSKWQSYITQIYFMLFYTTVTLLEIAFLCEILVLYLWLCYAHAGEVKNHQPTLRSRWTVSPRCPGCQWVAKQHDDSIVFSWLMKLMKLWTSGHLVILEHVRKKTHIKRRSGKRRQVQFVGAEACQCDDLKAPPLRHCSEPKQSPSLPGVPQRITLQSRSISPNASASQRTENSWIIPRAGCMWVF